MIKTPQSLFWLTIKFYHISSFFSINYTPNKPENTQGNTSSAVQNITKLSAVNHKGEVKINSHSNKNEVLPKTGLDSSSSSGLGIFGVIAAFLLGRKKRNN